MNSLYRPVGCLAGIWTSTALLATLTILSPSSSACTRSAGVDALATHVVVYNGSAADEVLTRWTGSGIRDTFAGCGHTQRVSVRFTPSMVGLTFVRYATVDGMTFPAYAWSSTSPLIVFRLYKTALGPGSGGVNAPQVVSTDADSDGSGVTSGTSSVDNNELTTNLQFALLSRGTPMTGGTLPTLRGQTMLTSHPRAGSVQSTLDLTVDVQSRTCTLSDTSLVLGDVRSQDLADSVSATIGRTPFNVRMNCPFAGTRVTLKAYDARGSTLLAGQLTPGRWDSATGVRIQLLRSGQPLRFGQAWDLGAAPAGDTLIPLEAQYIRAGAAFGAGTITGEAKLVADYL